MDEDTAKATLHRYLADARRAILWKCEGLGEYDVRRPLTPTGTNLLGLVKHLSIAEAWYFGAVFDRPYPERLTWWDDDAPLNVDMWAEEHETRAEIVERYEAVAAHSDETIRALDLGAPGHVRWWDEPAVTLHRMLVHMVAETQRHAGHADILREGLDGVAGLLVGGSSLPDQDAVAWEDHRRTVERAARRAAGMPDPTD